MQLPIGLGELPENPHHTPQIHAEKPAGIGQYLKLGMLQGNAEPVRSLWEPTF